MQNNMAAELADRKDFAGALAHAQRAVELDPDSASAHGNLANALMALGPADAALPHAQRSVELDPDPAEYRYVLGKALHLNNRDREAMQQLLEMKRLRAGQGPAATRPP